MSPSLVSFLGGILEAVVRAIVGARLEAHLPPGDDEVSWRVVRDGSE